MLQTVLIILTLIFLYYFYRKFRGSRHNVKYMVKQDPGAQALYTQQKHKDDKKTLGLKETMKVSWEFLNKITQIVMKKFSAEDRKAVTDIGTTLLKSDMHYQHNANSGITSPTKTQKLAKKQEKETKGRGV